MDTVTVTDIVSGKLGYPVNEAVILAALALAEIKLQNIIKQSGDDDGERLKTGYIAQLTCEQIIECGFSGMTLGTNEKRRDAEANAPLEQFHCITNYNAMQGGN